MLRTTTFLLLALLLTTSVSAQSIQGFYRFPELHDDTLVFSSEGDLWTVGVDGGTARRLTTHPSEETHPALSPDGRTLAFTARYEGPVEVYTMPLSGGLPTRWTFETEASTVITWTPAGDLVYSTTHYATLPNAQLVSIDLASKTRRRIPLSEASEATYDASGDTLFFVRPADHRNVTKRYRGGTARQIWRFAAGAAEAVSLTSDYTGESHSPMWWNARVYFVSDRDGIMNIWSMAEDGDDLRQHTTHLDFDVKQPSLSAGRIVHQVGADLWLYDIATGTVRPIPIALASDLDQLRERWVDDPMEYLTAAHLNRTGTAVALTARGRVFVAPTDQGRLVQVSRAPGVRYRDVVFMPDGDTLLGLTDETGELEFALLPANGVGASQALTDDGQILRFEGHPSPDGRWIAYTDNNDDLWVLNVDSRRQHVISSNREGAFDIAWSPDSRWLAYSQVEANSFARILLYNVEADSATPLTSDRVNSTSASWSPDGAWIYFLSDRNLRSVVNAPWGPRQPEPFFDKPMKVYHASLQRGARSPFKAADELSGADQTEAEADTAPSSGEPTAAADDLAIQIDLDGIDRRVKEVPVPPGNYRSLIANDEALFWISRDPGRNPDSHLMAVAIGTRPEPPTRIVEGIRSFELSSDGSRVMVRKGDALHVFEAAPKAPADLAKARVDLGVPNRCSRGLAADLHRRMATRARLLLRPGHARTRLGGGTRQVPAAGRSCHDSGRAERRHRSRGRRALSAAHQRARRRSASRPGRRRSRELRGEADA